MAVGSTLAGAVKALSVFWLWQAEAGPTVSLHLSTSRKCISALDICHRDPKECWQKEQLLHALKLNTSKDSVIKCDAEASQDSLGLFVFF